MKSPTRSYRSTVLIAITLGFSALAAGTNVLPGDVAVARFIQRAPAAPFADIARFGNWIGSAWPSLGVAALVALLLVARWRPWEAGMMLGAFAARGINGLLKDLSASPRPSPDLVRVTEIASGYGFPSGHTMGSTLVFGAISVIAHQLVPSIRLARAIQGAAVAIMLAVGFGRIYVGAHWPTDVLAGYLWGGLLLYELTTIVKTLRERREAEFTSSA